MIELLGLLVRNVPINHPLRLRARPNLQLLAEGGNVLSIFWTSCEQLQRQNIVNIYMENIDDPVRDEYTPEVQCRCGGRSDISHLAG